ncbi:hypothetical protein GMLC_43240 [Geomonas limicola]|uniref:Glycine-zipper-containing OmpA-like membrane domain-containing protein n=1 Tax=Geomonas limicola TaxID=2740186 RepID=A0A6V8NDN2_9BACT|nr:glycine zipper family protein [Geomonas limicola]GFO70745.1 hypothetical protein GMLC_43240 [Geomonas limicola]
MRTRSLSLWLLGVLLVLAGCATMPTGPSVRVLPAPGKSFEEFQTDDAICRQWAERQVGISPQERADQNTATGAVAGTVIGGGLGAALGAAGGHAGAGAAIGAGTGLLFGTAAGASSGESSGYESQRNYDNTYVQCMYAKGNQIPGVVRRSPRRATAPPPPPPPGYDYAVPPDYYPAPGR